MKLKFDVVVRLRKRNKVFKQETGRITSNKLVPFAGKKVTIQVNDD